MEITGWFQAEEDLGVKKEELVKMNGVVGDSRASKPKAAGDGNA